MPVISCVFAPSLDTPAHIELAERLGYRRAWCYDSPAVYADPWMVLALAAGRTRAIGLGPASLVPSLRHPVVTAAALATLVRLAKRAPGSGIDDFWRQADRASDWSSAAPYGLRGATRALALTGAYRRGEPACDVIDELAFDDEASAARCLADPAFRRAWQSPLLDAASLASLVVEEHVAKPGPVPASFVKNYELVTRRPDMDRAEFDRYWAQVHGPLAATIPTIRRYVQAHLSPGTREAGTAPYDGLAITWFDDVAAMRVGASTEAYAKTRADEANFLAGELPFVITTERTTFPRA